MVFVLPVLAIRRGHLALVLGHVLSICLEDSGHASGFVLDVGDGGVDPIAFDLAELIGFGLSEVFGMHHLGHCGIH